MPTTASEGIKALPNLISGIRKRVDELEMESRTCQDDFIGLVRVGGGRDDHAAVLLRKVKSEVAGLARFLTRVENQMVDVIADPFGDARANAERVKSKAAEAETAGELISL